MEEKLEKILKDPQLFERVNKEFNKKIVGEHDTRKTIFLIACGGRLVKNRKATSGNLLVNCETGSGKDFVIKNVLKILPQENCKETDYTIIKRTRISPTTPDHWDIDWTGKLLYVEDISNRVLNSDIIKVCSSNDDINSIATITNRQNVSENKTQKGKPILIFSGAKTYLKNEMLRRFPICKLDESEPQTKEIINKNVEEAKVGTTEDYDNSIKEALVLLERVNVKIPFADKLKDILPTENLITRTIFPRFLDYIKFSTAIHQLQREIDNGYLIATPEDYDIARMVVMETITNEKSIPLTNYDEKIQKVLKENKGSRYSVDEILDKAKIDITRQSLKPLLDKLVKYDFAECETFRPNVGRPYLVYWSKEVGELNIPKWGELIWKKKD